MTSWYWSAQICKESQLKIKRGETLASPSPSPCVCVTGIFPFLSLIGNLAKGLSMEGLTKCKAELKVLVHPSKSNNVRKAVLRELSSLLFTYDEIFEGVILSYEVHIPEKSAEILPGLIPLLGVKVVANLLLFSPRPNMLLEGKVVELGKKSIHAVVLGFSSASIMSKDICAEFKYKIKDGVGAFVSIYHKRHKIKAGSMIRFLVKRFDEETLHFSGSLIESNTGCIHWLSKHGVEDGKKTPETDRKLKRQREKAMIKEMLAENPGLWIGDGQSSSPSHLHKTRKRKSEE